MPITTGPFNNVPAPGDPTTSAWAQQLTAYVVARANAGQHVPATALPSGSSPATNGRITVARIDNLPAGRYSFHYSGFLDSTAPLKCTLRLSVAAVEKHWVQVNSSAINGTYLLNFAYLLPAAANVTVDLANTGTAAVTTYADQTNHTFYAIRLVDGPLAATLLPADDPAAETKPG